MNQPAFPIVNYEYEGNRITLAYHSQGMSLRDYFAAKTMAALVGPYYNDPAVSREDIAVEAYRLADAMLGARKVSE